MNFWSGLLGKLLIQMANVGNRWFRGGGDALSWGAVAFRNNGARRGWSFEEKDQTSPNVESELLGGRTRGGRIQGF